MDAPSGHGINRVPDKLSDTQIFLCDICEGGFGHGAHETDWSYVWHRNSGRT